MANMEELYAALQAADAAGNTEDAKQLADYIRQIGVEAKPKREYGLGERAKAALGSGLEQVPENIAGIGLGLKSAVGMDESVNKQAEAIRAEAQRQKEGPKAITFQELEDTYGKDGAIAALKKMPAYLAEQVLQSAPSMAGPLAAGATASMFGGPLAGAAAGIGTYGLQQFGNFINRQAQEGATAETLAPGKAAATAAATAPIGYFADRLTLGLGSIPQKILGKEVAAELARRTGGVVARGATGATIGIVAEAPTEVLEQVAERWQAGLPLNDERALAEYKEAFFGAAAVGGTLGGASRVLAGRPQEEGPIPLETAITAPDQGQMLALPPPEAGIPAAQGMPLLPGPPAVERIGMDEVPRIGMNPRMIGYSPLPGVPKIFPDGTVALTPEQEMQARYGVQKGDAELGTNEDIEAKFSRYNQAMKAAKDKLVAGQITPEQFAGVQNQYNQFRQEYDAYKERTAAPLRPDQKEAADIADKIELLGEKNFADAVRGAIKSGREIDQNNLQFYNEKLAEFQARKAEEGQRIEEVHGFSKYLEGDKDNARFEAAINSKNKDVSETLKSADEHIQKITDAINQAGYKVDAIGASSPAALRQLKSQMSQLAGIAHRLTMENEATSKGYKRADAAKLARSIEETKSDIAKAQKLIAEASVEKNELVENPEITKANKDIAAAEMAMRKIKRESMSLWTALTGKLSAGEVRDIFSKKPTFGQRSLQTQNGGQVSDLVSDGTLDQFLPPHMRHDSEKFDEIDSTEYIKEKLRNQDYVSFDAQVEIEKIFGTVSDAEALIREYLSAEEANKLIQEAQSEQDRINRNAEEIVTQGATGAAEGVSTQDLADEAKRLGVDVEAVAEDVARRAEGMTQEQYNAELRKALTSEVNKNSDNMETLAQANAGQKGFTASKEDLARQAELKGKTMIGVAEWAVKNAPNKFSKFVSEKILARLKALEKQGVTFNFNIEDGPKRSNSLYNAQGITQFIWGEDGNHTVINIKLNGAPIMENQAGYPSGLGYDTIMHELLHAATRGQMRFLASSDPLVKELRSLFNTVVKHFNTEVKAGRMTPFMERIYSQRNNALLNPDELISWGLTDKEMQAFLNEIKVGEKTVMDKIVQLVRELLGIPKPFETALDRLVRTTDKLLEADVKTLANGMVQEGYTLGRKAGQQTLFSKKAQELFGKEEKQDKTNLPAFKRWFKNSKVVDANGKPVVMYHGTAKDFSQFDTSKLGDNTREEAGELGFFFTAKPFLSDSYAEIASRGGWAGKTEKGQPVVYPVYISLQNPKFYKTATDFYRDAEAHKGRLNDWRKELQGQGFDGVIVRGDFEEVIAFEPAQIKSVFNKGAFDESNAEILSKQSGKGQPQPSASAKDTMDILGAMGRFTKEADPTYRERVRKSWDNARDNPKATAEAARQSFTDFMDKVETWSFSSDAALNNRIRKEIMDSARGQQEKIGILLNASLSQTVHSDAVANLFLRKGKIRYDNKLHKWVGEDADANFVKLSKQLDAIAEKEGFTKEQIELVAHTAFEAKRTKSLVQFNAELADKIQALKDEARAKRSSSPVAASALSKEAARLKEDFKFIHLEADEIAAGMDLFKRHPELNEVVKTWNAIRDNAADAMVKSGLWSADDADFLLSNADYVPFYREDQLENNKGPKEFIRGLKVQAKERKLKGSEKPVNDIFDNQMRWTQYSINRAVRNRSALALADTAVEVGAAKKVESKSDGPNVISVWRNGKEEFFSMDDPMFMQAFTGLEAIVIPSWKWASDLANLLRQSVVMYPLFSVAQVPQDSFAAMFSSGLKPQHALRIPVLAVKEFIQTLRGKSRTHDILKNVGAVGVRDFTSSMVRMDAEIYAGFKAPPGVLGKVKHSLNNIAMAADNAVRQAVYEASMDQGLSQAEALEKAFDVFNVRRKGSSKSLALAGQLIPFFSAYLAAQNVAYKTITGRGISPTDRENAFKTLAATTASVMTLSLLYAMMNGDDEDYNKKPATVRDRLLMIPGTGGLSIPLRADLFTIPKIITEHTYLMMTDKGYEDGRKFRESMAAALGSSLLGPTAVPQAIKPLVEVAINYDFFQGRPLIGTYQQKLETARQFTDSTSELGKFFGSSGLISPIAVDHLIRGMLGSVGGLTLYMTSAALDSNPDAPRPSLSMKDAVATLPGMGGFMMKSYESALKKDFYALKEEVDKASNTMNDLKTRSPQEIEGFLAKEKNIARLGLAKSVNKIGEDLSNIRKAMTQIANSAMSADQKRDQIAGLRQTEEEMLKAIDVKRLRELGKL